MSTVPSRFPSLDALRQYLASNWDQLNEQERLELIAQLMGVSLVPASDPQQAGRGAVGGTKVALPIESMGSSKVPDGSSWADYNHRMAGMSLAADIDLTEASSLLGYPPEFPRQGRLVLFYDRSLQEYAGQQSSSKLFRTFYVSDNAATVDLVAPAGLNNWNRVALQAVCGAQRCMDQVQQEISQYPEHYTEGVTPDLLWEFTHGTGHKLGGWPDQVQNDPLHEALLYTRYKPFSELLERQHSRLESDTSMSDFLATQEDPELSREDLPNPYTRRETDGLMREALHQLIAAETEEWMHVLTLGEDQKAKMRWGDCGKMFLVGRRDYPCLVPILIEQTC